MKFSLIEGFKMIEEYNEENIVSQNEISIEEENNEQYIELIEEIRGLREDVQNIANITFSVSVSDNNVTDNQP